MTIEYQFEYLSHAMRMQLEQIIKYPGLVEVDEKEAIYNIEIIVKSVLDAFHNVHDEIQKLSEKSIDFYRYPELQLILSIRNAKHHNKNIKSIFFEEDDITYVDFITENSFPCIIYPIKWSGVSNYIKNDKKGMEKYPEIEKYLNITQIEKEVSSQGRNIDGIYINIIPLMLYAGKRLVEISREYIPEKLDSAESKFFCKHFEKVSDNYKPQIKFSYSIEEYKTDIEEIIAITNRISDILFNGEKNPYLEDIKYHPKI